MLMKFLWPPDGQGNGLRETERAGLRSVFETFSSREQAILIMIFIRYQSVCSISNNNALRFAKFDHKLNNFLPNYLNTN